MSKPRTWTLERGEVNGLRAPFVRGGDVPVEPVEVIELDPVLDLLERWYLSRPRRRMEDIEGQERDFDTAALLQAHGRLQGEQG